ncbi:MAG: glycoside hydrolase family 3 C-terminal domain-containing protein [Lachnospiraceae bacterium]|nr:glycoside hydrolase family 3 C-terminal domain-containing protein [Lachnospiraceae bacterium]
MANKARRRQRCWRGLTALTASVLTVSVVAQGIVSGFRTDIDKFLGTTSTKIVTEGEADTSDIYTYTSDYSSTTELLDAIEDLGERMSEEGSVLLKNNGALPLSDEETKKVSLLGFSSYNPVQGGDMGSSLSVNMGTDADTVDFVAALAAKGFEINPTLQSLYDSLKDTFKTEVNMWGNIIEYTHIVAPSTTGVYSSKEPSQEMLDRADAGWKDSMDDYNVMIVTLARSSSENANYTPGTAGVDSEQNLNQTDPLGLSDDERNLIAAAVEAKKQNGGKVIVLLNNANAMEVDEIENNEGVDAILQIGLPGGYGFYGVADILSGEANPSGHLTDTYAVKNANSPAAQNYGDLQWTNPNPELSINDAIVEAEGIYTGYKYYETRYADLVLGQGNADSSAGSSTGNSWNYEDEVTYPFGYGLSYTTFEQTLDSLEVNLDSKTVTANVTVTNTGDVAGKDVVQLYVSLPYTQYDIENGIEKAAIQLLDYGKTSLLDPGASETVTITADAQYMASWDSTSENAAGTQGCYILDAGDYYFTVGNGAHEAVNNVLKAQDQAVEGNADKVKSWTLDKFDNSTFAITKNGTAVENQLEDMDLNYWIPDTVTYLTRNDWENTWPKTYKDLTATDEMLEILDNDTYEITANGDPSAITFGADNGLVLADLKGVSDLEDERWTLLLDQIELSECMIRTAFGGTSTKAIESIMSPEAIQNDGPNGFNSYPLGQYANTDTESGDPCAVSADDKNLEYKFGTMANATVIAQTFSKDLANEFGKICGNYSLWGNLTILWGAGINLHRVPYNARNHEYYSEDSILTAYQGASYIAGGKEYGCILAPKHLAFNDTEVNRTGVSVFMTEQKARETELRGTQACIEDAGALGIMTAYNRVGIYTDNSHYGLLHNILREEWGFKGLMTEDFIQDPTYAALKEAVHCGVTMTCNTGDNSLAAVNEKWAYWTEENVGQDAVLLQDLKNAMTWQNYALANSNAMDGLASNSKLVSVRTWYDNLITGLEIVFALLTICSIVMYVRAGKGKKKNA